MSEFRKRDGYIQDHRSGVWIRIEDVIAENLQMLANNFIVIANHSTTIEAREHFKNMSEVTYRLQGLTLTYIGELKEALERPTRLPFITNNSNNGFMN